MIGRRTYGIAVFHNRGDVLAATPVARQLKADDPECHVTWFTSRRYENLLEGNPYVDEVVGLEGDPAGLDEGIEELKASRKWTRFFTPAAYMNKDVHEGRAVFETVRDSAGLDWTVPFEFVLRLTEKEKRQADRYWKSLPEGPKILVETEFFSEQSVWEEGFAFDLVEILGFLSPVFLFTAGRKPVFLDRLKEIHPRSYWCREPFRLNAEFYNRCSAFVGVSSGISALTLSDYCRKDVLHVEVTAGWPWGAGCLGRHENLYVCFSRERYRAALSSVASRLSGRTGAPDFSPLFGVEEKGGRKVRRACPCCGFPREEDQNMGEGAWVTCPKCRLVYRKKLPAFPPRAPFFSGAGPTRPLEELKKAWKERATGGEGARVLLAGPGDVECPLEGATLVEVPLAEGRIEGGLDRILGEEGGVGGRFHAALVLHRLQWEFHPLEVLDRIAFLLAPGGLLLLTAPLAPGREVESLEEVWPLPERPGETILLSPGTLKALAFQAGFFPLAQGVEERTYSAREEGARMAELFSGLVPEKRGVLLEKIRNLGLGGGTAWLLARKRGAGPG